MFRLAQRKRSVRHSAPALPLESLTPTPPCASQAAPALEEALPCPIPLQELLSPLHQNLFDTLPLGIIAYSVVSRTEFRIEFLNRLAARSPDTRTRMIGQPMEAFIPPDILPRVVHHSQTCLDTEAPVEVIDSYELASGRMWARTRYLPVRAEQGPITHLMVIWEDITALKERELEALARQEEIIQYQAATLEELSTPLLAISDRTVVLPLIGTIDTRRAQQLVTALLDGVTERRAQVVILDITGVPLVDTQVANVFLQAAQAVALVGAQLVLTGIRAEVAQTIVGLGINLQHIVTRSTLQDGIAFALRR